MALIAQQSGLRCSGKMSMLANVLATGLAVAVAGCAAAPVPVSFTLPVKSDRGQLVPLDELRLPEPFRGRWLPAGIACHPDKVQRDALETRTDRLVSGSDGQEAAYLAIRGYADFGEAVEVEVAAPGGPPRLLYLAISADRQSLQITKGGERAVDGVNPAERFVLRSCPVGS